MAYLEHLSKELKIPKRLNKGTVLDLYAGAGGLALGFEAFGFKTTGYENDPDACETYNLNLKGKCYQEFITESTEYKDTFDVIIGGPPCQPFSVGGLQNGNRDKRDGFPAFLSAVRRINPKLVLIENVRGMLYKNKQYFEGLLNQLRSLNYIVEFSLLNAVHYSVPQKRERLFIIAHKSYWEFPEESKIIFTVGDAIGDLQKKLPKYPKFLTPSMDEYVAKYEKASACVKPRDLYLDKPSRTVTCRNLNGATGDMLRVKLKDGRRRRLTVQEGARLQSFPDSFKFLGSEGSQFNQIGNAVPPLLAKALAKSIHKSIMLPTIEDKDEIKRRNLPDQIPLFV